MKVHKLLVRLIQLLFFVIPVGLLSSGLVNEITINGKVQWEKALTTHTVNYLFLYIALYTVGIISISLFAISKDLSNSKSVIQTLEERINTIEQEMGTTIQTLKASLFLNEAYYKAHKRSIVAKILESMDKDNLIDIEELEKKMGVN